MVSSSKFYLGVAALLITPTKFIELSMLQVQEIAKCNPKKKKQNKSQFCNMINSQQLEG